VGAIPKSVGKLYGSSVTLNDFTASLRIPISAGMCSNFLQSLACVDATDCDNSCDGATGKCRQTGKPCATIGDCRGSFGPAANGACVIRPGQRSGQCSTDATRTCTKNSDCAVTCVQAFDFNAELSAEDRGNYWGLTCAEGGFLSSLSPFPALISDSHPYGVPVADLPDDALPLLCR
jgi:hypothetical protein